MEISTSSRYTSETLQRIHSRMTPSPSPSPNFAHRHWTEQKHNRFRDYLYTGTSCSHLFRTCPSLQCWMGTKVYILLAERIGTAWRVPTVHVPARQLPKGGTTTNRLSLEWHGDTTRDGAGGLNRCIILRPVYSSLQGDA